MLAFSATGIGAVGSMTGLYYLWYKDYPRGNFHFFDDNKDWLQMDKMGHLFSTYQLSRITHGLSEYACLNRKQSIWLGTSTALLYMNSVEIFDGYSQQWGASWGDIAANTLGWLVFTVQQDVWNEQRLAIEYSFFPSKYANYRPDLLGNNLVSQAIKDYNGITHWLTINPSSFFEENSTFLPNWLCISIGYSGDGLLGGTENAITYNGQILPHFQRQRQYYLSLDIDFTKIETNSRFLRTVFFALNTIKVPFPAIEYGQHSKWKFKPFFF